MDAKLRIEKCLHGHYHDDDDEVLITTAMDTKNRFESVFIGARCAMTRVTSHGMHAVLSPGANTR